MEHKVCFVNFGHSVSERTIIQKQIKTLLANECAGQSPVSLVTFILPVGKVNVFRNESSSVQSKQSIISNRYKIFRLDNFIHDVVCIYNAFVDS